MGPLLFIIFINDLICTVTYSVTHHFADDTNLLYVSESLKKINKYINHDLELITDWLRANKIALNASKTEIILFRSKSRTIKKHLNFHVSGQKIEPKKRVKYLGIILDEHLSWETHVNILIDQAQKGVKYHLELDKFLMVPKVSLGIGASEKPW